MSSQQSEKIHHSNVESKSDIKSNPQSQTQPQSQSQSQPQSQTQPQGQTQPQSKSQLQGQFQSQPSKVSGQVQTKQRGVHTHPGVTDPTIQLFNRLVAKQTHCLLGRTGVKVSRICLGSLNFGKIDSTFGERPGQLSENEAHKILDRFVQLGGNCIDTADFYPWFGSSTGQAETIIGNWLKK